MELQSDGRISNVELAARVNLSPAACLERVRKLHESGYIMGYTAQLNPQLLDVSLLVFIEVVLDRTTPEVFDAFKHSVQLIPEVLECHMVAGGFDYLVKARVKDMAAYREFLGKTLLQKGVRETHTYAFMEEMKLLQQPWLFRGLGLGAAALLGTVIALFVGWLTDSPLSLLATAGLSFPAALAAALLMRWQDARQHSDDGARRFARVVGDEIDAIMIGAAETSFFVDSVKAKVALDVGTSAGIADRATENLTSSSTIAANAEQAARIAAQVKGETVAGRNEADLGLQRIRAARTEAHGMTTLAQSVSVAAGNVETVHGLLGNIEQSSSVSEQQIGQIAQAAREHVDTSEIIAQGVGSIRDSLHSTEQQLPRAAGSAQALAERAEVITRALSASAIESSHDPIRQAAQQAARDVGRLFESAIASGQISQEALFDRHYTPIPDTNPPKHKSRFDDFTDRVLPPLQEAVLEAMPQLAYAGAVDNNGYFP
eukprot:gene9846-9656_t